MLSEHKNVPLSFDSIGENRLESIIVIESNQMKAIFKIDSDRLDF